MADFTVGNYTFPHNRAASQFVLTNVIDFATNNIVAATDAVVQLVKVPANTLVTEVIIDVETAEDSTCTFDVGDGTDPNGWDDAIDAETTGKTVGDGALAPQKLYTADDTIDLTMDNDADAGKVRLYVVCTRIAVP